MKIGSQPVIIVGNLQVGQVPLILSHRRRQLVQYTCPHGALSGDLSSQQSRHMTHRTLPSISSVVDDVVVVCNIIGSAVGAAVGSVDTRCPFQSSNMLKSSS